MKIRIKIFLLNLIRFLSGKRLIVSLTSYPARYDNLHLVIDSLLNQRLRPSLIILYLYDNETESLPEDILKLQSRVFKIVLVSENIRPHKKYYYAFKTYPRDLIITVDDDYIYPKDLTLNLYRKHLQFRNAIIAGRCRKVLFSQEGELLPYNSWPLYLNDEKPEMSLVATGVGGVLYSPKLLDRRVFDLKILKELALNQDDLWLKVMEIMKGTKTVPITVDWKSARNLNYENGLFTTNEYGANDVCLKKLMDYYQLSKITLKDES